MLDQKSDSENIFRILVATDIHLGFAENDPVRGEDTFDSFEEILQQAVEHDVDFILLGGDLFHDARPSPYCLNKCTGLIRKYCLGDKLVETEFVSDASCNFGHTQNPLVNYEDPNLNIAIPVFSIHGNHDDPTGKKQVSAMDLLASSGLVNYFGRWDNVTQVHVTPLVLRKGHTSLAIYGLSHIRDDRLSRLFQTGKVTMDKPEDGWFNLLVLHQNRADRGAKNFISEHHIPDFMDLVIWGHEHDCRIDPVSANSGANVYISQPGSSVATSLAAGESIPKKIGLLLVKNHEDFDLVPIELKTVRPFIYKEVILAMPNDSDDYEGSSTRFANLAVKAEQQVDAVVERMITDSKKLGRKDGLLPLIRLSIKYKDERQVFNAIRYSQKYSERVANPQDMIIFAKVKAATRANNGNASSVGIPDEVDEDVIMRVEDLIPKCFNSKNQMEILSIDDLTVVVKKLIDGNDVDAVKLSIDRQEKEALSLLVSMCQDEEDIPKNIKTLQKSTYLDNGENTTDLLNESDQADDVVTIMSDSDDSDVGSKNTSSSSNSTRGRGRGSRSGRGSRARKAALR